VYICRSYKKPLITSMYVIATLNSLYSKVVELQRQLSVRIALLLAWDKPIHNQGTFASLQVIRQLRRKVHPLIRLVLPEFHGIPDCAVERIGTKGECSYLGSAGGVIDPDSHSRGAGVDTLGCALGKVHRP
jgi:hypothetical protein